MAFSGINFTSFILTFLTHSMEQSLPREANRFLASQEIPRILWKPKVHYRIHKCPRLSLSWAILIKSMLPHPTSSRSILILHSHLRLGFLSRFFPSVFPTKTLYAPLLPPIRATWPVHLILLYLFTVIIFSKEYRSLSCASVSKCTESDVAQNRYQLP